MPVSIRLAMRERVLSSRASCASSSPDISGGVALTRQIGQTAAQLHGEIASRREAVDYLD
jgi:hypothetical protein